MIVFTLMFNLMLNFNVGILVNLKKTTYIYNFSNFFYCVALDEARDINMHLKPLRRHLEDIEQADIPELPSLLPSMMHSIGLLWGNSKYYCQPARIVVLLQEIGNLLIELVIISTFQLLNCILTCVLYIFPF